ncbi:hypothetical protein ACM26V_14135 [Salipaludibacillus sp. HK11]|uniref:hypothetical protein n=1 Tax=Salipaludibacillus sp. HK11 TaxID=3394320 RepID=UPI0039FCBD68
MVDTLHNLFTVSIQKNQNDTYTFVGLVNVEDLPEGTVLELNVKEISGFLKRIVSTTLDEFRYFAMEDIPLTNDDFLHLYLKLSETDIIEKIEFIEE